MIADSMNKIFFPFGEYCFILTLQYNTNYRNTQIIYTLF